MSSFGFIPPQQVQVGGPTGTNQGPNPSMMGPNQAGQVAQAAGQLLQGAANMKQAEQAHYKQKYDDAVQGIAAGTLINPDYTQIMKWGQRAGLPMKADVTPADVAAHQQTQQQAYAQNQQDQQASQVASGLPGNPAMAQMASMAQQQLPPSPAMVNAANAPSSAATGFMGRLGQGVNHLFGGNAGRPDVSMDSAMGQFLQGVSKGATPLGQQVSNASEEADLQHHLTMATKKLGLQDAKNGEELTGQLFQQMIAGDPKATEILAKTGHIKDMPIDSLEAGIARVDPNMPLDQVRAKAGQIMLFQQTGGQKLQAQLLDIVKDKDFLSHFDNNPMKVMSYFQNPTDPNNQPHMSVEEEKTFTDSMKPILDNYIGVPVSLVAQHALLMTTGHTKEANAILKTIESKYPSASATDASNKKATIGIEGGRLQNDIVNTQGTLMLRGREADTQRFEALRKGLEDTGALPEDMIKNPKNYDRQQYIDAANLVASKNNAVAQLMKAYGGTAPSQQVNPINNIFSKDSASIAGTPPPDNWMAGMLGTKPVTPTFSNDQRVQALKQQLLKVPKADRARVLGTTAMPKAVRDELMKWDPEKEALQKDMPGITNWLQDIGK